MSGGLPETLGIRAGARVAVVDPPAGLAEALEPLPARVQLLPLSEPGLDVVVFFTRDMKHLVSRMPSVVRAMALSGRLWIVWRPDGIPELDEVLVRQVGLEVGLVDDRRAAVLPEWTGLRLRWRSRPRLERPSPRA
ncbi:MAG: DUF3052 domain-containing protein [Myxococcaceae bacterium]